MKNMKKATVFNSTATPGPHYPELIDKEVFISNNDLTGVGEWSLVLYDPGDGGSPIPYVVNNCDLKITGNI